MAAAWRHRPTAHPPPTAHRPSPRSAGAPPSSPGTGEWTGDGLWRDDGSRATGHHATQRNAIVGILTGERRKIARRAAPIRAGQGNARRPSTNHHACAEIPRHSIRPGRPCISDSVTMIDRPADRWRLISVKLSKLASGTDAAFSRSMHGFSTHSALRAQLWARKLIARKRRRAIDPSCVWCGAVLYLLELTPQSSMCGHVWLRAYQRNIF